MSRHRVLIECLDNSGNISARELLTLSDGQSRLIVGRSIDADFVLNDEYTASLHASITIAEDGSLMVSDLGSVNGIVIADKRIHNAENVPLVGNSLRIGRTHLRLRSSKEVLPPERFDVPVWLTHPALLAVVGGMVTVVHSAYEIWLEVPQDMAVDLAIGGSTIAVALIFWIALWALLSRIMQDEWRFLRHAAIVLVVSAVFAVLGEVASLTGFMFEVPSWDNNSNWYMALFAAILLYLHLRQASSTSTRRALVLASILPIVTVAGFQWVASRNSAQDVNAIGAEMRIYPPEFRMKRAASLDSFFAEMATLDKSAEKKRDALPPNDNGTSKLLGF